ncbi:hypothetical protein T01_8116 [Trichinella spiralis]|uniref:Uncharacterized protein n=1 Tax=Trichinella spiralis TaxID=6334 RepID=A0A0V0YZW6_TRISP|nr:hypothetical protein T01_8116 [Trichinella spiralis]
MRKKEQGESRKCKNGTFGRYSENGGHSTNTIGYCFIQ